MNFTATFREQLKDIKREDMTLAQRQIADEIAKLPKPSKYGNVPVKTDEGRFDSSWEYQCWCVLKRRVMAGEITKLRRQVEYELHGDDGSVVGKIRPDFQWIDARSGKQHVADAKGMSATKDWALKAKMFAAEYGIEIEEIRRK